jgi:hypothetical protein
MGGGEPPFFCSHNKGRGNPRPLRLWTGETGQKLTDCTSLQAEPPDSQTW